MVEYLKKARPQEEGVTQKVRDAVSEILLAVEKVVSVIFCRLVGR
jgi:hypothetical protein